MEDQRFTDGVIINGISFRINDASCEELINSAGIHFSQVRALIIQKKIIPIQFDGHPIQVDEALRAFSES